MRTITTSKTEIVLAEKELLKLLGLKQNLKVRNVCFKESDKDKNLKRIVQITLEDEVSEKEESVK